MQRLVIERDALGKPPVEYWEAGMEDNDIIHFLKEHKGLRIDRDAISDYYSIPVEGGRVKFYAGRDAILVFTSVERDAENNIIDVDFSILSSIEFAKRYKDFE